MLLGLGLNVLLAPLASDLSFAVEDLNEENPGLFQSAGAYAQAYSMFNSGLAAGMMVGPPFASFIYTRTNWAIMNFILAAICLLGTVPVVCGKHFLLQASTLRITWKATNTKIAIIHGATTQINNITRYFEREMGRKSFCANIY